MEKNIFFDESDITLSFAYKIIDDLSDISDSSGDLESSFIDYTTNRTLEEFCRINQYYSFNNQDKSDLKSIYADLFSSIGADNVPVEIVSKNHYHKIKRWLLRSNPFVENEMVEPVACAEYSFDLQIDILNLDMKALKEPILDIGCGKQGSLVRHLLENGFVAFGIDRFVVADKNLDSYDWLEFNYGKERWGTIVSNLGFSNHFNHHNLRADGNYVAYGEKYMDILNSLKVGGRFHYAPDLPFIEEYLDDYQFAIEKNEVGDHGFKTTIITRLQ